jgi:hypothetical protein
MKPEDVRRYYKTTYNFRKETGMSSSSLLNWMNDGSIPMASQCRLEEKTNGDLKADWKHANNK